MPIGIKPGFVIVKQHTKTLVSLGAVENRLQEEILEDKIIADNCFSHLPVAEGLWLHKVIFQTPQMAFSSCLRYNGSKKCSSPFTICQKTEPFSTGVQLSF